MHYHFFVTLLLFLLCGAMFCNGVYEATRGWELPQPDGTIKKVGRVASAWYFFWTKKTASKWKYIQFDEKHASVLMASIGIMIIQRNPDGNSKYKYMVTDSALLVKAKVLEEKHSIVIDIEEGVDYVLFNVYKKEEDFTYPEWLRDMLVDCIYCFASFYGSLFFWIVHIVAIGTKFYVYMYGWTNFPFITLLLTWMFYVICLSFMNGYLHKLIHKK